MTRQRQELPAHISETLRTLKPPNLLIRNEPRKERFYAYVAKLVNAGWTFAAIGDALGQPYQVAGAYYRLAPEVAPTDLPDVPEAPRRPRPSAKIRPDDGDPRHGTTNGYGNLKCRCDACKQAWSLFLARKRRERKGRADKPHGTRSGYYNWACRCDDCSRAVNHDPDRQRAREDRIAAIRDLIRAGLRIQEIAERTGASASTVSVQFKRLGITPPRRGDLEPTEELLALRGFTGPPAKRDALIVTVRGQGFTLDRIAAEVGLTRERVRQIANGINTRGTSRIAQLRLERDRYRLAWLSARRRARRRSVEIIQDRMFVYDDDGQLIWRGSLEVAS